MKLCGLYSFVSDYESFLKRRGRNFKKKDRERVGGKLTLNRYLPARLNSWRGQAAPCDAFNANECVAKTNWLSKGWPSIDRRVACQVYNSNNSVIHYGKSIRSSCTRQAHATIRCSSIYFYFDGRSLICFFFSWFCYGSVSSVGSGIDICFVFVCVCVQFEAAMGMTRQRGHRGKFNQKIIGLYQCRADWHSH